MPNEVTLVVELTGWRAAAVSPKLKREWKKGVNIFNLRSRASHRINFVFFHVHCHYLVGREHHADDVVDVHYELFKSSALGEFSQPSISRYHSPLSTMLCWRRHNVNSTIPIVESIYFVWSLPIYGRDGR